MFLVLSGLDYAKGYKTRRTLDSIQTEFSQTVQEHGSTLHLLAEITEKQKETEIISGQYIKLGNEIREIYNAHSYQISSWRNLKKNLNEAGGKLQQAMAEIQFAKANLESSGMSREKVENLLRQLCEQMGKDLH